MRYTDRNGKFFTEEEVADLSSSDRKIMGIQEFDEDQEKKLFDHMDEMLI